MYKLAVQNGEQEKFGSLLGWDDFTQTEEKMGEPQALEDNSSRSSVIASPAPTQIFEKSHQSQGTATESFIAPFTHGIPISPANWTSSKDNPPMATLHQVAQKNRRVIQANAPQQTDESPEKKEKVLSLFPPSQLLPEPRKIHQRILLQTPRRKRLKRPGSRKFWQLTTSFFSEQRYCCSPLY